MIELTDLQKIGLGLVGFGGLFLTFGVFLFLDKEQVEIFKFDFIFIITHQIAQWVDMEAKKNHALSACRCVTTLLEADSRLLICRTAPRESKKHERDA